MGHVTQRSGSRPRGDASCGALTVPVSGDLENGYGHAPQQVAETVTLAAEAGLAGGSIEDTALPGTEPYPFGEAVARVEAAVLAARELPDDFVLVARADGVMNGRYDVDEAINRIQAFEACRRRLCLRSVATDDW